jgi:hypothetical protein
VKDRKSQASLHFHTIAIFHTSLSQSLNGYREKLLLFQARVPYKS